MKILFYGDSITDAMRDKENLSANLALGAGYVMQVAGRLYEKSPVDYEIINRGISGNRIVDLYARIKKDVWNIKPDLLSILVGINDIWHEIEFENGVDIERFDKIYRMMIDDTIAVLPNTKIILCEPFVCSGSATDKAHDRFCEAFDYAKVIKKIADDYGLYFLPLQKTIDEANEKYGNIFLSDGVHPSVQGAVLIANEWIKLFNDIEHEVK